MNNHLPFYQSILVSTFLNHIIDLLEGSHPFSITFSSFSLFLWIRNHTVQCHRIFYVNNVSLTFHYICSSLLIISIIYYIHVLYSMLIEDCIFWFVLEIAYWHNNRYHTLFIFLLS